MNITLAEGAAYQDGQAFMLQIYPRLSQEDTASCCTLQVSAGVTAAHVIQNAGATLGLDMSWPYSLLEVQRDGGETRALEPRELPVERVLLWPPRFQKQHPQSQGYFFILQRGDDTNQRRAYQVQQTDQALRGEDTDDLCNLSVLTEDSILGALRQRFDKRQIYTYASGILIAINPFKFLPIYNPKYVKMYENQPLGRLRPHIFAVADVAFHAMLRKQVNQCIVISGESGSGKTQSTNFLIHCLTALSQKGFSSGAERTILGAGPVLEAFGNAKTAQNNNSSRFGKFIQVNYLESGVVRGAVIEKYLLEKCRLVFRDKSERNYHVFYYLLVGAAKEEQKELRLLQPQDYLYLNQENFDLENEEDFRHEYKRLHQAMEMVGFLPATKTQIFSVLSAILYLGNITYTLSEDGQVLEAGPADVLSTLSDLLKVKKQLLVEALTKRKSTTAKVTLVLPYSLKEATTTRDSMAKSLYGALFDWILLHINHALLNKRDMEESVSCLSIGILDIFGFEDFKTNSFEQFCINYANERLQHYFNQHIFTLEQEEYCKEGITWHNIDYTDNMSCIHLISKKPTGLFHLLDEESNLPQGTNDTLLNKFKQQHQNSPLFVPTPVMEPAFVLHHFAGRVKYQIKDFREKNTDHMRPDIVSLLRSSKRAFVRQLIGSNPAAVFRWGILRATIRILATFNKVARQRARERSGGPGQFTGGVRRLSSLGKLRKKSSGLELLSPTSVLDFSFDRSDELPLEVFEDIFASYEKRKKSKDSRQKQLIPKNLMDSQSLKYIMGLTLHDRTTQALLHPHQKKKPPSISAQFQASLNKLLETLGKAEPFFIHCLRSNAEKKEMHFDESLVRKQLRYTGMLETVRMRKSGYGAKYTFKEFLEKFIVLLPKKATATPEDISSFLQKMGLEQTTYKIGKTKVFLKEHQKRWLQETLNKKVMQNIVILQRWFRTCLIRKHFLEKKDAAILIQNMWRGLCEENRCQAATVIQAAWRTSLKRKEYLLNRDADKEDLSERQSRSPEENKGTGDVKNTEEPDSPVGDGERPSLSLTSSQRTMERAELRRQRGLEHSPNRSQEPGTINGQDAASKAQPVQRTKDGEQQEGRGSPPPLSRPLSLPLGKTPSRDTSPSNTGSLQRYTGKEAIKEKGEKWKERRCDGGQSNNSSPEANHLRTQRTNSLLKNKGKSMSVDNLTKSSSSDSDTPPPASEPSSDMDGSRLSTSSSNRSSTISQLTTPEKSGFLSKILKWRTPRDSQNLEDVKLAHQKAQSDKVTSPTQTPYRLSNQGRNPSIRISRATRVSEEWNASLDREIRDVNELRHLDEFLGNQVNELRGRIKELSDTENIFLVSTMQFRETIKSMYSVSQKPHMGYKGLMMGYKNKVTSLAGAKQLNEVQLVVNLFQSVLDGFIRGEIKRKGAVDPVKTKKKTKKRRKNDMCADSPLDHMFSTYQVNIMQSCDLCGSYIWGMEKACMCSACKLVCHKKCLAKIITDCSTRCAKKHDGSHGLLHFGVPVYALTNKSNPVPMVVEMMLEHVEMNGLYTEGIYRKSGSTCRARELYQILETDPKGACLDNYPIHTITGLVKRWLRELPDPLMTFTLYSDFLHAVELPEKSERIRAVYKKLDELPSANFNTLERLIFHLVRVAKEEANNRMSANSLAIVFAPCILRSPDASDPFLGMKDISKTTLCVEVMILEQLRRYNEKMQDIQELEYAETQAVNQLRLKRQNTIQEKPLSELSLPHVDSETSLIERIRSIKEEKDELVWRLPELEQENSDDNLDYDSSRSSESLADELLQGLVMEGGVSPLQAGQRPECPFKPADLAERVRALTGKPGGQTVRSTPGSQSRRRTDVTQSLCIVSGQGELTDPFSASSTPNNQSTIKTSRSFDDLDIPFIDEDS
ncbi:unconventional myosin-IXb isoform X4 [Hypomesus transpacificus]|uniref:unconventional myosin-IXb isoform X4 n=1 Tax=Hypomesus transpacificus TaxID=137520 RepID=UPI001F07CBCA|nr:unconventional myosin-IXb isoform X4 [Hypomesus transpacificus]